MALKPLQSGKTAFVAAIAGVMASMTINININFDVNEYLMSRQDNQERIHLLEKIPRDDSTIHVLISCPANDLAQCNHSGKCCRLCIINQATPVISIEPESRVFCYEYTSRQDHGSR